MTVSSKRAPYEVFKRAASANWRVRFSLPKQGQFRLPLKTDDHNEALLKAATEYQRAVFQAEHDLLPGKMSFDKVALGFLDNIKAAPPARRHTRRVSRINA